MGALADVPLIVDTSALAAHKKAAAAEKELFRVASQAGELRTHPVVRLEFLHHAFDRAAFAETERKLSVYPEIDIDSADGPAAVRAMHDLAYREPEQTGYHKVKAGDALIAVAAVRLGIGVLHHDHDFERLAQVLPSLVQVSFAPFK